MQSNLCDVFLYELASVVQSARALSSGLLRLRTPRTPMAVSSTLRQMERLSGPMLQELETLMKRYGVSTAGGDCSGLAGMLREAASRQDLGANPHAAAAATTIALRKVAGYMRSSCESAMEMAVLLGFDSFVTVLARWMSAWEQLGAGLKSQGAELDLAAYLADARREPMVFLPLDSQAAVG